jgi:glycosyltransferase involved in cell wall biosynthesis
MAVSVVIPTYNRAHLIERAVRSALAQCRDGDEILVVDDGSTDNTAQVMSRYGTPVRYFRVGNSGAGAARNFGVRHACNPLIAFLDSDDEWMPDKLELQRRLLAARSDILYCFSNFAITTPRGRSVPRYLANWLRHPRPWQEAIGPGHRYSEIAELPMDCDDITVHIGDLYAAELIDNYVLTSSLVVRREEAGEALRFAEDLPTYEDWYCFGRLARKGLGAYLDCDTTWQHGHDGGRLTDADNVVCALTRQKLVERIWSRDSEFQSTNARLLQTARDWNRLDHARALVSSGSMREARNVLHTVRGVPPMYRMLSILPGPLARWLAVLRRRLAALRAA